MYNFVLFCKSYIGDIERISILKNSIDQFNTDNIPFCIVCPLNDIAIFKKKLVNGCEKYPIHIYSDEEVLQRLGIAQLKQSWFSQQIIKLGFYKMRICNHYSILDSDCYFINNFCIADFMYDEKTPYIYIHVNNKSNEEYTYIQNYFGRRGYCYDFIHNSQVFSKFILESLEQEILNKQKITFCI